jgi:hypothetical protein
MAGSEGGRTRVVESSEESATRGPPDNPEDRSMGERCIMSFGISSGPVMTDQLYNNTYQFVQTKDSFVIWVEMVHDVRIVRMNAAHRTDGLKPWMGDSIGWWDGDTLVVETIGYHPGQNLRGGGPNMKVTERFTRVAPDRVNYAFDVQDPQTWAEPWGGEYEFASVPRPCLRVRMSRRQLWPVWHPIRRARRRRQSRRREAVGSVRRPLCVGAPRASIDRNCCVAISRRGGALANVPRRSDRSQNLGNLRVAGRR